MEWEPGMSGMTINRENFVDSVVTNPKLMSPTMHQWCIAQKGKENSDGWKKFYRDMNDKILFYIIRYGGINVDQKLLFLNMLEVFTDDEEVLENIKQYKDNKKEVDKAICEGHAPKFIFNVYWGTKFNTSAYLNHLHDNYEGSYTSFNEAIRYIRSTFIKLDVDERMAAVDNTIHIITKDKLLKGDANPEDCLRYGFITVDGNANILSINASYEWITHNHPFKSLGRDITFDISSIFKPGTIVKPHYCELNEALVNDSYVCFVRDSGMNHIDEDRDKFGIYITVYDRNDNKFYDFPTKMNPFMFDVISDCTYADDAKLYDFIKKYQDHFSNCRMYSLTDLLNAAIDLKGY